MNYYKLAIVGNSLPPLSYQSEELLREGDLVTISLKTSQKKAIILQRIEKPSFTCKNILEKLPFFYSSDQLKCADFIYRYYVSSMGESLKLFTPFSTEFKSNPTIFSDKHLLNLSSFQKSAIKELDKHSQGLLFGDTGSGKTEIYIYKIKQVLKKGKNVIFLMPEISLTPQMQKRLEVHFGDLVAIWHSKLSKKIKEKTLQDLQTGKVRIIAGARSALFLPIKDVSLIIVDEEHDESYKSNQNPRYNAKDVSLMYAKILNAKIILGSATPSITSFKKLPIVRLKGTFFKSEKTFFYENEHNQITPNLLSHINDTLKNEKQSIIFVPTRANFKYLTCKSCSTTIKCPFCDVAMSLHVNINALKCHYCNYTSKIAQNCPSCGDNMLEANRIGTIEVAKILSENFSKANIAVFDKDSVSTDRKLKKILKEFNQKNIDILVGTQMLSKGHDYQDVALSVVLGLDNLLNQPDFKAREKALSLAIQIAGRAGRKGKGKVYMQTKNRDFFDLYMSDYESFLKDELTHRKNLYPPYKRLLRILISHKNEFTCKNTMEQLVDIINPQNVELVGYGKSPLTKIANKYRYEILLRSTSAKSLIQTAFTCKRVNVQIDMDALSFS